MFTPQPLGASELNAVITYAREIVKSGTRAQSRDAVAVLFGTIGLRIQEVINLRVEDYRAADRLIDVRTLKGGRRRQLPLDRQLCKACDELAAGEKPDSPLLRTRSGGRLHQRNLRRRWSAWCREALGRSIRFHDLRHSMAHYVYAQDGDIFAVQRLLGHRKIETTHLYLRSLKQLASSMPGADDDADSPPGD